MNRLGVLAGLFAGTVLVSLLMRGMVMAYTTEVVREGTITLEHYIPCLLYTSDAADED